MNTSEELAWRQYYFVKILIVELIFLGEILHMLIKILLFFSQREIIFNSLRNDLPQYTLWSLGIRHCWDLPNKYDINSIWVKFWSEYELMRLHKEVVHVVSHQKLDFFFIEHIEHFPFYCINYSFTLSVFIMF